MSAETEHKVTVGPLVILEPDKLPKRAGDERKKAERQARIDARALDAARWTAIQEAGGSEAWIQRQLREKGLAVDTDPTQLKGDAELTAYKERKKAEATERKALKRAVWAAYRAAHLVHVGAGVYFQERSDEAPADKEARLARARAHDLPALETAEVLRQQLGLTPSALRWLCFHRDTESSSHYHFWTIPKRDGSKRLITAPKAELKAAQRWLLRNVFEKLTVHHAAHGFLAGRSIASNAAQHAGADVVVKVDIRDFFPTITFRRVKGLLKEAGFNDPVATLCALLVTEPPREVVSFRGQTLFVAKGPRALPQGAPTSPAITNAICIRMDRRLSGLARLFGFVYTRYADDLTFSYRKPEADNHSRAQAPIGALLRGVREIVENEGFRVHDKKTSVMRGGNSQRVTGLVINRPNASNVPSARVPRDVVRRLKAAIHNREQGKPGKEGESLAQLKGLAAFVHMVDPARGRAFLDRIAVLENRSV